MTLKRMTRRGLPNLPKARAKAPRRNERPKAKNYFSNQLLNSNIVVITCLSSTRFVNFCVYDDIHILLWKIKDADVPYSKFDIENKKRITAMLIDFMVASLNFYQDAVRIVVCGSSTEEVYGCIN